ncbi:MAG: methyl-accepting chemotaxis protein [Pseudomonadota bacterium]
MTAYDHSFDDEIALADRASVTAVPDVGQAASASVEGPSSELSSGPSSRLDRFSVAGKLRLAAIASCLMIVALGGAILGTMAYFGNAGETLRVISVADASSGRALVSLYQASDHLEAAAAEDDVQELARSRRALEEAVALLNTILEQDVTRLDPTLLSDFTRAHSGAEAALERLQRAGSNTQTAGDIASDVELVRDDLAASTATLNAESMAAANPVFAAISTSLVVLFILFIVVSVAAFVGARALGVHIAGMITALTKAMQNIAHGQTQTRIPGHDRRDELGEMARALSVFRSSLLDLRDLTAERAREAETRLEDEKAANLEAQTLRTEQSAVLGDLAQGFQVSVGEVIASVQAAADTLRSTSKGMVDLAQNSRAQSSEATSAMEEATRNVTAAAAATDEFALSITEISRQATASASLAREANDLVGSANAKMNDLSEAAKEIGDIASLIQTIAQRTNLLALNASIEAARGGEAGRGFAVVASEVKELATQTSHATSSVAEKIAAMQSSTEASASDLGAIVDQIGKLEQASVVIASAVDQQSISGEDLARNIDTVAAGSAEVGERLEALNTASQDTGDAAGDVLLNAEALGRQAETLQAKAGQFISEVQRASREMASGQ